MLEEEGAELAVAHLREIPIYYRLLVFIKVGAMVSLFCRQSEPRARRARQCHNICFDCEPRGKDGNLICAHRNQPPVISSCAFLQKSPHIYSHRFCV